MPCIGKTWYSAGDLQYAECPRDHTAGNFWSRDHPGSGRVLGNITMAESIRLQDLSTEEYCYLTTTGRVSGNPHEIEIWFGVQNNSIYLMSGGGTKSDWVKNLLKNANVTVRIAKYTF